MECFKISIIFIMKKLENKFTSSVACDNVRIAWALVLLTERNPSNLLQYLDHPVSTVLSHCIISAHSAQNTDRNRDKTHIVKFKSGCCEIKKNFFNLSIFSEVSFSLKKCVPVFPMKNSNPFLS